MTSRDIVDALAAHQNISKAEARAMLAAVLDTIAAGVAKGEVSLSGFGSFKVSHRPARPGRNPRTGEAMFIAPSRSIRFRPAKALKDRLAY